MKRRRFAGNDPENGECPICPICEEDCETFYRQNGEIIGCENCIEEEDAWYTSYREEIEGWPSSHLRNW